MLCEPVTSCISAVSSLAQRYLMKLGYLPQSGLETEALRSEAELTDAIKAFQAMAHVPETGELDKPTIEKMLAPRLGL